MRECNRRKILVALSGGMDSAAVVLLLRARGWAPEALYLDMLGSPAHLQAAGAMAARLGVKLHVEDCRERFAREIIGHMLETHAAGRTPAPCSRCNPLIKWRLLAAAADRFGIRHIATGHYVRSEEGYFARGLDPAKDQSYYLWGVPRSVVLRAVTPLGTMTKSGVRDFLRSEGFAPVAAQPESMSLCFLARGEGYADFLRSRLPLVPGDVVTTEGKIAGRHDGTPLYTVGQKKGFSCSLPGATVTAIDAAANLLTVSADPGLLDSPSLLLSDWRAVAFEGDIFGERDGSPAEDSDPAPRLPAEDGSDGGMFTQAPLTATIRGIGRNPRGACLASLRSDGLLRLDFTGDAAWAAAPGQPVALYRGDRVVGGGIIS